MQSIGKYKNKSTQFDSTASFLPPLKGLLTIRPTSCLLHFPLSHSFLPCLPSQFCRSEGSSLHRDIIVLTSQIQQECLHILCLTLWFELLHTGLIQTASSQHTTSNTFLFKLRGAEGERISPLDSNMLLRLLSLTRPVQICFCMYHLSLILACCLQCWT